MEKLRYLIFILFLNLFLPSVSALTYDISTKVVSVSDTDKSLYEIRVSLNHIGETSEGVWTCSMGIKTSETVKINDSIRALSGWNLMGGQIYLVDTSTPVLEDTDLMIIPVKVNNEGMLTLTAIECSDGIDSKVISNREVNLKVNSEVDNNPDTNIGNSNEESIIKDSNCNLSDIKLSDGIIEFDPNTIEYSIKVHDISKLEVDPILQSEKATSSIEKIDNKIIIKVTAEDSTTKIYTLYVEKLLESEDDSDNDKYVPIFIGIICVLVLINIIRLARNLRSKS